MLLAPWKVCLSYSNSLSIIRILNNDKHELIFQQFNSIWFDQFLYLMQKKNYINLCAEIYDYFYLYLKYVQLYFNYGYDFYY